MKKVLIGLVILYLMMTYFYIGGQIFKALFFYPHYTGIYRPHLDFFIFNFCGLILLSVAYSIGDFFCKK